MPIAFLLILQLQVVVWKITHKCSRDKLVSEASNTSSKPLKYKSTVSIPQNDYFFRLAVGNKPNLYLCYKNWLILKIQYDIKLATEI